MFLQRKRVVYVVDDDDGARDSTLELLRAAGSEVVAFASGQEFLEKLEPTSGACVVLDLHMPDISGFQVLEILRAAGNMIPVILFTGRIDPTTEEFARRAGTAALLAKPGDYDKLVDLVQRLVGGTRGS